MGKYRITDPSGSTFEITAPDGASESEIMSYAQKNIGSPQHIGGGQSPAPAPEPTDAPWQEDVKGFVRQLGSGASFGLTDVVGDAAQTFEDDVRESFGFDPSENTKTSKQYRDQFAEQHPALSMGASIGGGIINPVARGIGNAAMVGKTLLPKMVKSSGAGGVLGGAQAFGEAGGPLSERLKAGGDAAMMGAALGPLVPAAVKTGSSAWTGLANKLAAYGGDKSQLSSASRLMAKAIEDDGYTMETALKKLKELGPESTLADLGDNTRSLMHSVYARGGAGSQNVARHFSKRQGGTPSPRGTENAGLQEGHAAGRVRGMIDKLGFGKYHDRTALDKLQKEASELYEKAYAANKTIDHPEVNEIMNRELMKSVMGEARKGMNLTGENVSLVNKELTALGRGQGITTGKGIGEGLKLKFLDKVKKRLWSLAEQAKRTGDTDLANDYNTVRRDLTRALDKADTTKFYKAARAKSGGKIAADDARERGKNFISKSEFSDDQTMADELAEMSLDELQNFRMGVAQALKSKVSARKYKAGNAPDAIKGDDSLEARIKVAFGDDDSFVSFKNQLLAEDELHRTYSKLTGSPTSKNLGSIDYATDPNTILEGLQTATHSPVRGTIQTAMGIKDKLLMPKSMSKELAYLLTRQDLTPIEQQYKAKLLNQLAQNKLSGGGLAGVASAIGSSGNPNNRDNKNTRRPLANRLVQGR